MFDGKKVLITGGTGSLGKALTKQILKSEVDTIRIYSRDELKQSEMQAECDDSRLRFLIGDVRDKNRIFRALEDIEIVIHAAALKQVPAVEYNPFEAVKTNVYGTQNLIDACLDKGVKTALAVGTDKAVAPFNTYGATKLLMERLFISANYYKGNRDINFVCVRYGNVIGSRGSLVPTLKNQIQSGGKVTITDPDMTRFNITMEQAVDLIMRALTGIGGEVFIPKLKAYKTGTMKDAIMELLDAQNEVVRIPVRPGEKYHESLISKDEIRNTFETKEDYILFEEKTQNHKIENGNSVVKSNLNDRYSSDKVELLTKEELKNILTNENLIFK